MQIGSVTPSGAGLGSGSRRHRMRRFLGLPRELWIEIFGKPWSRAVERKGPCLYVCTDGSRRACGVGSCARLQPTKIDPRETSGPQIERIPSTRPSYAEALFGDDGATLNDLREAVTTLEDLERTARRVLGDAHPLTTGIREDFCDALAALSARETPSPAGNA